MSYETRSGSRSESWSPEQPSKHREHQRSDLSGRSNNAFFDDASAEGPSGSTEEGENTRAKYAIPPPFCSRAVRNPAGRPYRSSIGSAEGDSLARVPSTLVIRRVRDSGGVAMESPKAASEDPDEAEGSPSSLSETQSAPPPPPSPEAEEPEDEIRIRIPDFVPSALQIVGDTAKLC